ncbi:MAG: PepSY-like domain-containing protein [Duncaniella sp.]|nr:PepSY-like domain-containing protein [Duncaniella sp.]
MKKIVTSALAILMASSASLFAADSITKSELPKRAQNFITTCFANDSISSIEKGRNRRGTEYEVEFANGAELEFNDNGTWRKISAAPGSSLPPSFVPKYIADYITQEYPGEYATKILKNAKGYEVEISSNHDLHFDLDERFVRVDR